MKKLFTLGLFLIAALGINAAEPIKYWNFTKGFSQETLDNLAADAASGVGYWTSQTNFFESKARTAGEAKCKLNGEDWIIPETAGLEFGAKSAKHLCLQYEHATLGPHVWLNGGKAEDCVTIKEVPAGEKMTIIYSSHKDTEARGFKVSPAGVADENGETTFKTMGKDTVVLINNNDKAVDVKLTATSGMHYHIICVGDMPEDEPTATQVAFLYDSETTNPDEDVITTAILSNLPEKISNVKIVPININASNTDLANVTVDSLATYSVVVLSDLIPATNPYVGTIKSAIAFVPMLNFTPALYPTWGYGNVVESTSKRALVGEGARENDMFKSDGFSILEDGYLTMTYEGNITGYTAEPGSYFYNDSIIAKVGDINVFHAHNLDRNAYMMMAYAPNIDTDESVTSVAINAIVTLNETKAAVSKTNKPAITEEYHHKYTTVSIKTSTKRSKIYYTLDGSEPTTESTLYTEPFDLKESLVVKALAIGDGYYAADVVEKTIAINELADAPSVSLSKESGKTTVTLIPANEGDVIKYNYVGSADSMRCSNYTEPIVLTKHATITFFTAEGNGKLQSEPVSQFVDIDDEVVRIDIVSHFDANKDDWCIDGKSPTYYGGSKNAYNFYDIDNPVGEDEEGNMIYNPAYKATYHNPGKGWAYKTYGQAGNWQNTTISHNPADFNAYNPQTAEDDDDRATNYLVQFSSVASDGNGKSEPMSACLYTTEAIQGPFDVVALLGGYNKSAALYVATDTIDADKVDSDKWQLIGDMSTGTISGKGDNGKDGSSRIWRKNLLSYEGTDKVFVKLAAKGSGVNVFDIMILNHGEESEKYVTGIEDVMNGSEAAGNVVRTMVYSINGTQLSGTVKGINIIKEVYANGVVKTRKVVVK
ncbi:chitobiase/beta-hexosaminidase C-terminal domain-containing protein [Xylanibacter muris]|uniref:Chitobiase/beta-hexosaminidase C-terminal domain-containing protein n=1 Tax=Xylanibacter muris TaxID=2736290 RepID=A0ABX2AP63_9BACT|nr:chitobiase/beta-hexosaminidase C-terminal domain-containing protein [Xylanibacter muris]NPD91822.1 chitobiase/beta-hexosaminidase C-terminal domain-containing protein [Xylanibacter muris]